MKNFPLIKNFYFWHGFHTIEVACSVKPCSISSQVSLIERTINPKRIQPTLDRTIFTNDELPYIDLELD